MKKNPNDSNSVFLKACRLEKTSYTPIWLMRQAGRYMKEYRRIRDRHSFLEVCKDRNLVTEITVTAQEKINADAAIIFADILLLLEPMGIGIDYVKGNGPAIGKKMRTARDIESLRAVEPKKSLFYLMEAIRMTRENLNEDVPLIGFAAAPFTLASYMIEGGASKDFSATKNFMHQDKELWKLLMEKISRDTVEYLYAQIDAGVDAVQLFDSWVGALSSEEYRQFVKPYSYRVIGQLPKEIPVIHFGTGTAPFLEDFAAAGGDVIGVDHRVGLGEAWRRVGQARAVQGNLNPAALLGSLKDLRAEVKKILDLAAGRRGHIFNLGHGVLPETPVENVVALVEMVHEMSRQ